MSWQEAVAAPFVALTSSSRLQALSSKQKAASRRSPWHGGRVVRPVVRNFVGSMMTDNKPMKSFLQNSQEQDQLGPSRKTLAATMVTMHLYRQCWAQ